MAVDHLTRLANPAVLPNSGATAAAWGGDFLAIGQDISPFLIWYSRAGDVLTRLTNPAAAAAAPKRMAWSGDYLALVTAYYLQWYKRSGSTLTRLTNPVSPEEIGLFSSLAWSGDYLAVGCVEGTALTFFKRVGDVLSQMALPNQPTGVLSLAWSGDYLAAGCLGSPGLVLYRRDGDVLTRLTNPTQHASDIRSVSWSGDYLAAVSMHATQPGFYRRDGNSLIKLTNPPNLGGTAELCAWGGNYLTVGIFEAPHLKLYKRSGDALALLADPPALNAAEGAKDLAWGSNYLAAPQFSSPHLTYYLGPDIVTSLFDVPTLALTAVVNAPQVASEVVFSVPTVALDLSFAVPAGLAIPSAAQPGRIVYELILTGAADSVGDARLPLAGFQGRLRSGEPSYLEVVVPGSAAAAAAVAARPNGQLVLSRGKEYASGARQMEEVARVQLGRIASDRGGAGYSITLSGHRQTTNAAPKSVALAGVTYRHGGSGRRRFRAQFDQFLRPGDTATYDGESVVVRMISYAVNRHAESMEITEA